MFAISEMDFLNLPYREIKRDLFYVAARDLSLNKD